MRHRPALAELTRSLYLADGGHECVSIKRPGCASARMRLSRVRHAIQLPPCEVEACIGSTKPVSPFTAATDMGSKGHNNNTPSMGTTTDHLRPWALVDSWLTRAFTCPAAVVFPLPGGPAIATMYLGWAHAKQVSPRLQPCMAAFWVWRGVLGALLRLGSFAQQVICKASVHMLNVWQPIAIAKSLYMGPTIGQEWTTTPCPNLGVWWHAPLGLWYKTRAFCST